MTNDIRVGDRVKLLSVPDWLIHDLPKAEQSEILTFIGKTTEVTEIDKFGYYWLGFGSNQEIDGEAHYQGHSFCVPQESLGVADSVSRKISKHDQSQLLRLERELESYSGTLTSLRRLYDNSEGLIGATEDLDAADQSELLGLIGPFEDWYATCVAQGHKTLPPEAHPKIEGQIAKMRQKISSLIRNSDVPQDL